MKAKVTHNPNQIKGQTTCIVVDTKPVNVSICLNVRTVFESLVIWYSVFVLFKFLSCDEL